MTQADRVLPAKSLTALDDFVAARGGSDAIERAAALGPDAVIDLVAKSGLRGRGGAGFPTGRKWRTVRDYSHGAFASPTVVVNGAEGEPGSFKDRSIMRANPFAVIEGALIAANVVGAATVVIALKTSFTVETSIMENAVRAVEQAGWNGSITLEVFGGPSAYLLGEETGLLEAIDGRPPFPRIAPPFRRGVDEQFEPGREIDGTTRSAADLELAGPSDAATAAPTLVDNVETLANIGGIIRHGADWFRELGTEDSPGSMVCTVSGQTPRHGIGEFPMGTSLRTVLETVGGVDIDHVGAVLIGVSSPTLDRTQLDVALTYEAFQAIGSALGTGGFIVYEDAAALLPVAAGVARFLAVESCGQCTPCKSDGRAIADGLARIAQGGSDQASAWNEVEDALETVADGARCNLASQQQAVVGSLLPRLADANSATPADADPVPIVGIRDLVDDRFELDTDQLRKQPDWSFDEVDSGQAPADRINSPAAVIAHGS